MDQTSEPKAGPPPIPADTASDTDLSSTTPKTDVPAASKITAEPVAPVENAEPPIAEPQREQGLKHWINAHKKLSVLAGVILLIAIWAAVPWTRYKSAGLVYKKDITIRLQDDESVSPVSGATVSVGSASAITNGDGLATLHLPVGPHTFTISKQYYSTRYVKLTVPILGHNNPNPPSTSSILFVATGRQVKVSVKNKISGQPLADVDVSVDVNLPNVSPTAAPVQGKTDKDGQATLVVPPEGASSPYKAKLSLSGYNDASVVLHVGKSAVSTPNDYTLTPTGRVFFLSNSSGTLDVVSTNLDGSGKKTILAGTGNEDDQSTTMAVSPDNHYIALETNRTSSNPLIYIINPSSGTASVKLVDSTAANYTIYGWEGDTLVYGTENAAQPGKDQLKAFTPSDNRLTVLSQSSSVNQSGERFDFVTLTAGPKVYFAKSWYNNKSGGLSGQRNAFYSVNLDGSGLTPIAKYPASDDMAYSQYTPSYIYIQQIHDTTTQYYSYQIGGAIRIPYQ